MARLEETPRKSTAGMGPPTMLSTISKTIRRKHGTTRLHTVTVLTDHARLPELRDAESAELERERLVPDSVRDALLQLDAEDLQASAERKRLDGDERKALHDFCCLLELEERRVADLPLRQEETPATAIDARRRQGEQLQVDAILLVKHEASARARSRARAALQLLHGVSAARGARPERPAAAAAADPQRRPKPQFARDVI
jgi:hypothetical protein